MDFLSWIFPRDFITEELTIPSDKLPGNFIEHFLFHINYLKRWDKQFLCNLKFIYWHDINGQMVFINSFLYCLNFEFDQSFRQKKLKKNGKIKVFEILKVKTKRQKDLHLADRDAQRVQRKVQKSLRFNGHNQFGKLCILILIRNHLNFVVGTEEILIFFYLKNLKLKRIFFYCVRQ